MDRLIDELIDVNEIIYGWLKERKDGRMDG